MRIIANDAKGEEFSGDAQLMDDDAIEAFNACEFTREQVRKRIDNLNVSADAKFRLHSILEKSIEVVTATGKVVIWIGRKILDIVLFLMREFPNATFGVILGLVVGHLIGLIPIIGFLIAPMFQVILAAFGLVEGTLEDLRKKDIGRRVAEICNQFTTLKTDPA